MLRYIIQSGMFRAQASQAHFVMKHRSAARLSRGYTRFLAAVPSQHWRERCLRTPQWWNGLPGQRSQAIDNVKSKSDLNGTESKTNLGANAILGVCMACRAGAGRKASRCTSTSMSWQASHPCACLYHASMSSTGVHVGNYFAEATKLGPETY